MAYKVLAVTGHETLVFLLLDPRADIIKPEIFTVAYYNQQHQENGIGSLVSPVECGCRGGTKPSVWLRNYESLLIKLNMLSPGRCLDYKQSKSVFREPL